MAGPIRIAVLADAAQARREITGFAGDADRAVGSKWQSRLKSAGRVAGKLLAGGLLAGGAAMVKLGKAAATDEAAAKRLEGALRKSGHATTAQVSATERWVTAQGKVLGVTDDQLRPALGRLVRATGSVGKGQKLAALAMDVSAGSGKSLESVSTALARAQQGNVGSLSRLGVATKDAHGKTLSMQQITKQLARTYRGDAAAAAGTTEGKQRRLMVTLSELGESIGAKVLPAMVQLADIGLKAVGWVDRHQKAVAILVGVLGGLTAVVWAASVAQRVHDAVITAHNAVTKVAQIATKAWAVAQWALNAAMAANPIGLVVIAVVALVAAFVIAYKKSERFRAIVNAAVTKVKTVVVGAARAVWGAITGAWTKVVSVTKSVWSTVLGWVRSKINAVRSTVSSVVARVRSAISDAWGAVRDKTRDAWQRVVDVIRDKITRLMDLVRGIKDRVLGALSGAASWLLSAGKRIVQGLIDGIASMIGKVKDKLASLTDLIPDWKGPASRDKRLLYKSGQLIMGGLIEGWESQRPAIRRKLADITREVGGFDTQVGSRLSATFAPVPTAGGSSRTVTLRLTAQQVSQLQRGREIRADLDAFEGVGGRQRA